MTNTEKTILVLSIFFSWGFGFLLWYIFSNNIELEAILSLVLGGVLLWLTPFAFLLLFFGSARFLILAFALGIAGFLFIAQTMYLGFGLLLLLLGFTYWLLRVRYARDSSPGFSVTHSLKGTGLFFTVLAAFGALLYFYSPFASRASLEPKLPEKFFDAVYYPLSTALLSQFGGTSQAELLTPEELKPQIYNVVNAALGEFAKKYQSYIPFAFAAGAFFFLRAVFIPIKYLLLLIVFLLVRFFLKLGWLKKEPVQVVKETVKF